MAPVATTLCVVLIVWLLKRDANQRIKLSNASWVPTIVVFILASRTPSQWLGGDGMGNPIDQLYSLLVIGTSLFVLSRRGFNWQKLVADNPALMLFYGYFAISFMWSAYPGDSIIRLLKDFCTNVLTILVIFTEKKPLETLRAVYVRCALIAFPLSLLLTRYYSLGKTYDKSGLLNYNGVADQKNSLGQMLMIFMLLLVWDHIESNPPNAERRWIKIPLERIVLLGMGAWLLHLSQEMCIRDSTNGSRCRRSDCSCLRLEITRRRIEG